MASLRCGTRSDGSTYVQVPYRLDGKQSSTSFEDLASAAKFQKLVEKFGPAKAQETLGTDPEFTAMTVREWVEHRIEHLTGLTYDRGGCELGPSKTKKSVRAINVPRRVLDKLDLGNEWIFLNKAGRPVKGNGFHDRVWRPAVSARGPRWTKTATPSPTGPERSSALASTT